MGGLARSPPTINRAKPTHEEETMNNPVGGTAGPGQVISLTQRSAWRREYEMRAGGGALGWLRWRPGRRSFAQGEGRGIGIMGLATRRRWLVVARAGSGETLATADRGRGGSVIHVAGSRPPLGEDGAPVTGRCVTKTGPCSSPLPPRARYAPASSTGGHRLRGSASMREGGQPWPA